MNKKKTTLVVALVVMGIAVLGLAAAVYAKYIATLTSGTGSIGVAKWAFTSDNQSAELKCELDKTFDADTLVSNQIAPGTSGTCEILLSNENSEVGVDYTLTVNSMSAPTNLIIKDSEDNTLSVGSTVTGKLTPGQVQTKGNGVKLTWEWPYETTGGDNADTADGIADGEMSITFGIYGEQVEPTE